MVICEQDLGLNLVSRSDYYVELEMVVFIVLLISGAISLVFNCCAQSLCKSSSVHLGSFLFVL